MKSLLTSLGLLFVILTQCAWNTPGWETSYPIKPAAITYPGTVATTNQTLTAAQTGLTIIFNNSTGVAANGTQYTLPTATVGLDYSVVADTAKWFYLTPQTTDTINIGAATAGQRIANSGTAAVGDSIEVLCITAGQWSIKSRTGTWAVTN